MRAIAILLVLSFGLQASAGKEGGSSGVYVCRNAATHAVEKMELVDLWEARETNGQTIVYDEVTSVEDQVQAAIDRLASYYPSIRQPLMEIDLRQVTAGSDVTWSPPDDVKAKFTKEGCPLEGLMYFSDLSNRLVTNPELYPLQKRKTEIAAGLFHEKVYKYLRSKGAVDSTYARHIVGCSFSSTPKDCFDIAPPQLPKDKVVWYCEIPESKSTKARVYPTSEFGPISFYVYQISEDDDSHFSDTRYGFDLKFIFTKYGGIDLSGVTIETVGFVQPPAPDQGYSSPGLTGLGLSETNFPALRGNLKLGNPLFHIFTKLYLYSTEYNPLTFKRDGDQPVPCTLVSGIPAPKPHAAPKPKGKK